MAAPNRMNFRKSSNSSDLVAPPFPNKEDIDLVHNHVILAPAVEAGQGVLFGVETHLRLGLNKRQKYWWLVEQHSYGLFS